MWWRAKRQRLDQRDAQSGARLGVIRQALARRPVDQRVEVGTAAKRLGGDGMGEAAVVGPVEIARSAVESGFERQALVEDGVEQPQRGAAGAGAGWIRPAQLRRPSGSSALARGPGAAPDGEAKPIAPAIASRAAIRFSVAGWVENRLSPRPKPGTM